MRQSGSAPHLFEAGHHGHLVRQRPAEPDSGVVGPVSRPWIPRTTAATSKAAPSISSCSQNRSTIHPSVSSRASVSRSRSTLVDSLPRHQGALALGHVACTGQPCQKHPSTNTATFADTKARSTRRRVPGMGQSTRNLRPKRCTAERRASSQDVSRLRADSILRRASTDEALGVGLIIRAIELIDSQWIFGSFGPSELCGIPPKIDVIDCFKELGV